MPQAVDSIASTVEQLSQRVRDLERRIAALEAQPAKPATAAPPAPEVLPLQRPKPPATWRGFPPVETPAGAVPVIGKAVLGIAGAYLLRAIAESGTLPKLPILLAGIIYACLWMVWAIRSHASYRFAGVAYAVTSALILSPLLWEATVRFQALSSWFTAGVLVAFVVLTMAVAWQRDLRLIPAVAIVSTLATSVALIIATRDLVPFTSALLAVSLITEITASAGHHTAVRALPALAADFSVWLLVYVVASPDGVPEGYHAASPLAIVIACLALLAIYGGAIGVRSFVLRHRITVFEIGQGIAVFALTAYGTLRATRGSISIFLGILFFLLAAACYWGALWRFSEAEHTRNRRVCATWSAGLVLAGCFLLFATNPQILFLCVAASAAALFYTRTTRLSLGVHASCFLAAAAAISPLPAYFGNALAGVVPNSPSSTVWLVIASALACSVVGLRTQDTRSQRRALWITPLALVSVAAASLLVVAVVKVSAGRMELGASRLSVIRTIVICALALTLGFLGSRWKRVELSWIAYAAVAFGTLKLLFEDLRFGNAASLVVSLLFYGLVLILLPRLMRASRADS